MITVYLIFVALAAKALAEGSIECTFEDSTITHQCQGAEGQPLIFDLSYGTNTDFKLIKDGKCRILNKNRNGSVTLDENFVSQIEPIQNGKFKLGKAMKIHSGEYLLEEHDADGKLRKKVQVQLKIYALVSTPVVSKTCVSPALMSVTCSSKEDKVEFLMTLDDYLLIQTKNCGQGLSNLEGETSSLSNVSISLHGQLTGRLVCQVWSNFSRAQTVFHLTACKGSDAVTIPVMSCVIALFLFGALGFLVIKRYNKERLTPVNERNCENEVVYTDVRGMRRQRNA